MLEKFVRELVIWFNGE